jgi:hypothetical protein
MTKLISILSVTAIALSGCASAPDAAVDGEQHTVLAGDAAQSLGVHSYDVTQGVSTTQVILRGGSGAIGAIVSQPNGAGKRITVSGAGSTFSLELYADQVRVVQNGQELAVYARGSDASTWAKTPGIAGGLELLQTVASDPALHDALGTMRASVNPAGESAYMFGLPDCPAWVIIGSCLGANEAVCAYCAIAWL